MINFRLPVSAVCSVGSVHCKEFFAFLFSVDAAPRFFPFILPLFSFRYLLLMCAQLSGSRLMAQ